MKSKAEDTKFQLKSISNIKLKAEHTKFQLKVHF